MDKDSITFTVIMPAYNAQAYVRDAVDSIVQQTYTNWELIAVNDGSTDGTLSILNAYAAADSRVKLYSKENGGYVSAVNYGLDKAQGEYICFMGSDDKLSTSFFAQIAEQLSGNRPDMIAFRTVRCIGDRKEPDLDSSFDTYQIESDTDLAAYSAKYPAHSTIFFIRDTSKLFKRSIVGDLRYFGKYGLDADGIFSMLVAHRAKSFASVPVDGYFWTIRADSVSGRKRSMEANCDRIKNWMDFYNALSAYPIEAITPAEKAYIHYFARAVELYALQKGSRAFIAESVRFLKKTYRYYSVTPDLRLRIFLKFPIASAAAFRLYCRIARAE